MLVKNQIIVLSKLKYSENDLIIKAYTKQRGTVSYMLRGVLKSKKNNSKSIYYQLLSQLDIEENFNPKRELQYIKEVKFTFIYKSLHHQILKSTIVMFLSEVLSYALKEEEQNEDLFQFITSSLQFLDHLDHSFSNFHLLFLVQLSQYLGIKPHQSNKNAHIFNLQTGDFENYISNKYSASEYNSKLLIYFFNSDYEQIGQLKISSIQRQDFLNMLLTYFELHLEGFRKPKSLNILNTVFS